MPDKPAATLRETCERCRSVSDLDRARELARFKALGGERSRHPLDPYLWHVHVGEILPITADLPETLDMRNGAAVVAFDMEWTEH